MTKDVQTSDAVSSLAADYLNFSVEDLRRIMAGEGISEEQLCEHIRSMAGSALRSDQTKGKRSKLSAFGPGRMA